MANLTDELLQLPICKGMNTSDAQALLDAGQVRTLQGGQYLCRAGDQGDALYLVLEGTLDVLLGPAGAQTSIATVTVGQVAGELELLTGARRVATLTARHELRLLEIPGPAFLALLDQGSAAAGRLMHGIARTLARRLATANEHVLARIQASQPPAPAAQEPAELSDAEVHEIDDDDLAVLDKLWGT